MCQLEGDWNNFLVITVMPHEVSGFQLWEIVWSEVCQSLEWPGKKTSDSSASKCKYWVVQCISCQVSLSGRFTPIRALKSFSWLLELSLLELFYNKITMEPKQYPENFFKQFDGSFEIENFNLSALVWWPQLCFEMSFVALTDRRLKFMKGFKASEEFFATLVGLC